MHRRKRNDILQPLELARNERAVGLTAPSRTSAPDTLPLFHPKNTKKKKKKRKRSTHPRTSIAHIQVIPALLRRELGARLARDPVAERALLALEFARLVAGKDPVGDFAGCRGGGGVLGRLEKGGWG